MVACDKNRCRSLLFINRPDNTMPLFYWLKSLASEAFYFKSPSISRLETLDFVIEDKMLFMLSWEFAGKYKLSIPQLKKSYRSSVGSVVIKLPTDTNSIHLKIKTWLL